MRARWHLHLTHTQILIASSSPFTTLTYLKLGDLPQWSGTLTRFAWTGDPNGAGLPEWSQYKEGSRLVMHLDATSHVSDDPDKIHRELWVAAS